MESPPHSPRAHRVGRRGTSVTTAFVLSNVVTGAFGPELREERRAPSGRAATRVAETKSRNCAPPGLRCPGKLPWSCSLRRIRRAPLREKRADEGAGDRLH